MKKNMLLNLKPADFREVKKTLKRIGVRYLFDATTSIPSDNKKAYLKETVIDSINRYLVLSEDSDINDIRLFMAFDKKLPNMSDQDLVEYSKDTLPMLIAKVVYRAIYHRHEPVSDHEAFEIMEQLKLLPKLVKGR